MRPTGAVNRRTTLNSIDSGDVLDWSEDLPAEPRKQVMRVSQQLNDAVGPEGCMMRGYDL